MVTEKQINEFYEQRRFPADSRKHLPFAVFDEYCVFCRRGINFRKDRLSLAQPEEAVTKETLHPVWTCNDCFSNLMNFHFQVKGSYATRRQMGEALQLPFDDDLQPNYTGEDNPAGWFVSNEMKNAYLRILDYVSVGIVEHPLIFEMQRDSENHLIQDCFFLFDVSEKDVLFYGQGQRNLEFDSEFIPFAPNQEFIDLEMYLHPLARDIIAYLEDVAKNHGADIYTRRVFDLCANDRCSEQYPITVHEFERRKKRNTLAQHLCHTCLYLEGLSAKHRYFQTFCRNNSHSVRVDRTLAPAFQEDVDCMMCKMEREGVDDNAYDPMTQIVYTMEFDMLPKEENEGICISVKVLKSNGCGKYGCEVIMFEGDSFIELYDLSTNFRDCGLSDCRCYKSKIKAMVETLALTRDQFNIELKDEEEDG